ncbi:MAG TPA: metallophosphoesterase, partial [Candidatus Stercoripulliclostridium merdigallinarum]|nr:metallophosphoesterase [Candidatus Stercoripulliclostridium merdigallinarum]
MFDDDGEFTILHLTDFHEYLLIEGSNFADITIVDQLKPRLVRFIESCLQETEPDLVVLGGDNIFGLSAVAEFMDTPISIMTYRAIAELFEEHKQYWTLTFGNHDSESVLDKIDYLNEVVKFDYFIGGTEDEKYFSAKVFPTDTVIGNSYADYYVGNYSIPVYDETGTQIAYNIFVLDSGSYTFTPPADVPYLSITREQTDWYLSESKKLEQESGHIVPAVMFSHIPFAEMEDAYNAGNYLGGEEAGWMLSTIPSPIYDAILKRGDVKGVFFGHMHGSDVTVYGEGNGHRLLMGITKATQSSGYDDTDSVLGMRVINLHTDGSFATYTGDSTGYRSEPILWD